MARRGARRGAIGWMFEEEEEMDFLMKPTSSENVY
jgi:hypothetical protein